MNVPQLKLSNGASIPQVGLGVWQAPRGVAKDACLAAFRAGYRHVDTARIYGNENDVGEAVRQSGIPREELFVTTKLWNDDQGYDEALAAFDASLRRLGLDYVDLYLLHWPVAGRRLDSWRALEKLHADGRAKAIGVSNFLVSHLEELVDRAKIKPMVDQIEISPFHQQRATRDYCQKHGIVVEAYSPLTRGAKLQHPRITTNAHRLRKTNAQIMLRWGIEKGLVILPKSVHEARIRENLALFDFSLDEAAMRDLDGLDEGLATGWDPRRQA